MLNLTRFSPVPNPESILLRPVPFLARLVISFATSEDRLQDVELPRMAGKTEGVI